MDKYTNADSVSRGGDLAITVIMPCFSLVQIFLLKMLMKTHDFKHSDTVWVAGNFKFIRWQSLRAVRFPRPSRNRGTTRAGRCGSAL
jgi:hypothetical protein